MVHGAAFHALSVPLIIATIAFALALQCPVFRHSGYKPALPIEISKFVNPILATGNLSDLLINSPDWRLSAREADNLDNRSMDPVR
jgi:hypothetical protein